MCAYDRAGLGRSPPNDLGVGVLDRARELGRLLDQIGERSPVILIGHSNGALYAEAFARLYPERVAGLVYVNGVTTDARDDPRLIADLTTERRMSNASVTAARLGLAPLVADKLVADADPPPQAAAAKRQGLTCHACLVVARDEDRAIIPGLGDVARLDGAPLRAIPTVVITGRAEHGRPAQRRLARLRGEEREPRRAGLGAGGARRQPRLTPGAGPRLHRRGGGLAADRSPDADVRHRGPGLGRLQSPPFCSSSIEMLSGERTKAMWPSRGGRLMVTPPSISRWQVA